MTSSTTKNVEQDNVVLETVKTVVFAFIIAFFLRTFLFQAFHIPSSSMEPNLQNGDFIITTKYSLGYGKYAADPIKLPLTGRRIFEREPHRGDIIVFKPIGSKVHFIKRLIGLPGDKVQMVGGFLYINGERLVTEKIVDFTSHDQNGNLTRAKIYKEYFADIQQPHMIKHLVQGNDGDNTKIFTIPDRQYFFMGDNRDNSRDSRFPLSIGGVGFVPAQNLVGRAEFILLSVKQDFVLFKPWTWHNVHTDRFFKGLR
ncbi:MAG: signal peptidase I [Robiginitomaculum sp.]|nr:MAG: signal peptidase I [Robiginitomaculum sp.]